VAGVFATLGIWLGIRLTRNRTTVVERVVVREVPANGAAPFVRNGAAVESLGITPRELEILELIAAGLSNREIAGRIFVSENTVKTHSSRLFDKLGARRRTQAVQLGKERGLIP
jgi:ATP/maltotriose-dependent transcriptional regulator MalT